MNQAIIDWLIAYPETKNVYLNEGGEWSFHPRPGFTKVVTREDALAEPKAEVKEIKQTKSKDK